MDAVEESDGIAEGGGCRGGEGWEERDEGMGMMKSGGERSC